MIKLVSISSKQTQVVANRLGRWLLNKSLTKRAMMIGLKGDLGGGKTTFVQGLARGLGIKTRILSPTFVIWRSFDLKSNKSAFKHFHHVDCYRLREASDLLALGLKDILFNPQNIVAIEWVERLKSIRPKIDVVLEFKWLDKNKRQIILRGVDNLFNNPNEKISSY